MRHAAFSLVDFAKGDVRARNNVVPIREALDARTNGGAVNSYITAYRFPEEYREHCKANKGSVSDYAGPAYADYLHWDVDYDGNLHAALQAARGLVTYLQDRFDIRPDQIRYFFSGAKGFHILLPSVLLGEVEPSPLLPAVWKSMALSVAEEAGVTVDKVVYDVNRLFRLPDTQHPSRLWKVELTWEELFNLDTDGVRALARAPRGSLFRPHDLEPIDALVEFYAKHAEAVESEVARPRAGVLRHTGPGLAADLANALSSAYVDGQKHNLTIAFAGYAVKRHLPRETTHGVMDVLLEPGDDAEKVHQDVDDTYNRARDGREVKGYTELRQMMDPGALAEVSRHLGDVAPEKRTEPSPPAAGPVKPRFRLISDAEMEELPAPEPLVGDKIHRGSLAALVGPPGHGKTFIAFGWGASVAAGVPSCGDLVHQGPVVYVAAEGSAGLGVRIRAWKVANHITGALGVHFITEPVSLLNPVDVRHFLHALEALPQLPALVVLDTLARCMVGGDENSTQDMSAFIAGADRVRTETGAAVLILHHMNAGGERERGNTALRGACDTLMFVKAENELLTLTCEKQKDAPPFPKTLLRLLPVADSCAVITANQALQSDRQDLNEKQLETLALLQTHFLANGATTTEWFKASGLVERTFYNYRTLLVRRGYVAEPEQTKGGRYTLTETGRELVTASCNDTANILHFSAPKLLHADRGGIEYPLSCSNGDAAPITPAAGWEDY